MNLCKRRLADDEGLEAQDVFDVETFGRDILRVLEIAHREAKRLVMHNLLGRLITRGRIDHQCAGRLQRVKHADGELRTSFGKRQIINDDQLAFARLEAEHRTQRGFALFLGHREAEIARRRTVDNTTTDPVRRARRTRTGTTGSLLAPGLLAAAANLGARLDLLRSRTTASALPVHHFPEKMLAHRGGENGVVEGYLADLFVFLINNVNLHHETPAPT